MRKTELRELYKMMFPDYPDIVTVAQLQKMLGISRHLAYDLINDGYISGIKIGNAFKIPKVNVINYPSNIYRNGSVTRIFLRQPTFMLTLITVQKSLRRRRWKVDCNYPKQEASQVDGAVKLQIRSFKKCCGF